MRIITLDSIDSTNSYCLARPDLLRENLVAVHAIEQTAGRGRYGRRWNSNAGKDLTISVVYHPPAGTQSTNAVILSGIAVKRTLESVTNMIFSLKWPNDLLYNDAKISGILVEKATIDPVAPTTVVIGIGININSGENELPPHSTSLYTITGTHKDPAAILDILFEHLTPLLEKGTLDRAVVAEWNKGCPHIGRKIRYTGSSALDSGIFEGIDLDGSLLISRNNGTSIRYYGEVDYAD
jgi:BirA family transcriptional regulator, biotin operon repressor / biotin---[acetyl-CoA-carboxylase] ligase